jgi:hypothetical protein
VTRYLSEISWPLPRPRTIPPTSDECTHVSALLNLAEGELDRGLGTSSSRASSRRRRTCAPNSRSLRREFSSPMARAPRGRGLFVAELCRARDRRIDGLFSFRRFLRLSSFSSESKSCRRTDDLMLEGAPVLIFTVLFYDTILVADWQNIFPIYGRISSPPFTLYNLSLASHPKLLIINAILELCSFYFFFLPFFLSIFAP